ncbi:Coenzyme F420 hydrogenase/dehydrogenase, beta subunit C-terminal domain [Aerococcus kribbianus]|uniref:Coenzyme F420 hydrogenase/dehydrogenase, beta subunit C-terminal domain n=1 Tax=Aerococcus kribbianus TaxID=2999064 RepID=A0A9X3JFK6_9LACT|nr:MULTISPECIES: Coenzyme F420 hydrogenase/dehydrogenase, beta subunit C-terminal domain [unclassified Aerococcus]MCZ0717172.1 Coenzyme F420 hydrogenase/dehydrogenase, beta subunit C-terminal domain [Aerococcus sp. YH-aer221]MCZ0725460.1 Coenzyme F420 hydrogenase/dehydrogenase, beta subunit C-terminal domain [Aerococcus sp. YH-aer222]
MELNQFNELKKYSEASGVMAVIDDDCKVELNEYGLYEETFSKAIDDATLKLSPNFNEEIDESLMGEKLYAGVPNINYDQRLGYYLDNYVGHVNEESFRENASSGGFASWILVELYKQNKIDGVIHVKKSSTPGKLFEYDISDTIDEIIDGAKTKYYPVELSKVLKKIRKSNKHYAIVGIPSFIMAVRLLQYYNEDFKETIKYTIGLVCGHQKSSRFADFMAWQMGVKPAELVDIDFRHKLDDRPANDYGIKVIGKNNDGSIQEVITPKSQLKGQNWGHGYFKPFASDYTDDVMNETADVTVGDAWIKEYQKDSGGNNILVVRHPEINALIQDAMEEKRLVFDRVDKEVINRSQASHFRHTQQELSYRLYKQEEKQEWTPKKRVEPNNNISQSRKEVQDLRYKISTLSHTQFKKSLEHDDLMEFINLMTPLEQEYANVYQKMTFQQLTVIGKMRHFIRKIVRSLRK